jgi:hypothetical protein
VKWGIAGDLEYSCHSLYIAVNIPIARMAHIMVIKVGNKANRQNKANRPSVPPRNVVTMSIIDYSCVDIAGAGVRT